MRRRSLKLAGAVVVGAMLAARLQAADDTGVKKDDELDEIVVTGVMRDTSLAKAPISISVIDSKELKQQVPSSAAAILQNSPGEFVNTAQGEVLTRVWSRGISANVTPGGGAVPYGNGYYYVSLQEDGLPVAN